MSNRKYRRRHKGFYDSEEDEYKIVEDNSKRHFNILEYHNAMQKINNDPLEARRLAEAYVEKYPDDCLGILLYVSVLITLREVDLAEEYLSLAEPKILEGKYSYRTPDLQHTIEKDFLFSKMRIMSYRGQYKKLLDFINDNVSAEYLFYIKELKLLCKKKLGICFENRSDYDYLGRQVIKYDRGDMMHRVSYHDADYNAVTSRQENVFAPDFPLNIVIDEIEKYIPSEENMYFPGLIADCYYFRYDCCGKEKQKTTNFIEVACFHGTSDIITITPVLEGINYDYIDINYIRPNNNDNPKLKRLSRTDRFNKRYGRN